jgi:WD40 repeat protein
VDQLGREVGQRAGQVNARLAIRLAIALVLWASAQASDVASVQAAGSPVLVVQTGHQNQVQVAVFSADSRMLASGDIRGPIKIWETATGKLLASVPGHLGQVSSLAFSPDGGRLASAGGRPGNPSLLIKIWDVGTGRELHRLSGHQEQVEELAFGPDGAVLATAGEDVRLWDTASGRQIDRIETRGPATLAFSPDGRLLAIREPSRVRLWTVGRGELATVPLGNFAGRRSLAFTRDGARLAVPDGERLQMVDVSTRKIATVMTIGHDADVLGFTDAGCVIRSRDRYELWDVAARKVARTLGPFQRSGERMSPDFRQLVTLNEPRVGSLTLADIGGERPPIVLADRVAPAGAVAFSPDGALLAAKSGGRFWVWDLRMVEQPRLLDGHRAAAGAFLEIDALAFTGDGKSVISADRLWNILQWDVGSGQVQNSIALKFDKSTVTHACSADGRWCVSGQQDRIDVREVETWRVFRSFETGTVRSVAISDDGASIAAAHAPNLVDLWERASGRHRELTGHTTDVSRVAFAPGGRLLASADFDGTVRVWDPASGRPLKILASGHTDGVTSLAFSPDGRTLATGGADDVIRLWDLDSESVLHELRGHVGWVAKLAFSPDGKILASGSGDGTTRLWDAKRGVELALLTAAKDSPDWLVVTPDGLFDGSYLAGENLVAWRVGDSAYPPVRYFNDFFRPDLLASIWKGDRPRPAVGLSSVPAPPQVRIAQASGATVKQPRVSLRVRVQGPAAEVSVYQNGARVANQPGAPGAPTSEYVFDIDLVPGENDMRAVALSPAGVLSNPDSIRLTYETPAPAKPALHVLAVGISRYQEASWNLGFARADAEALGGFFRQAGGGLFHPVNVKVLTDAAATWSGIRQAITDIADTARPEDVVLIYFAGHGIALERRYYLLPHEMHTETLLDEAVKKFGVADAALQDALRKIKAVKRIVVLDACESGTALEVLARTLTAQRAALETLVRAEGVFIIAASTRQQEAIEIPELGHGILTYALLSGLGANGADKAASPGIVTMYGLLEYISRTVPELAARYGRNIRQVPVSFHRGMDFPLVAP